MKKTGIVDCTLFYAPYHSEIMDFRINLLKDHVDWFIITEANRSHTGDSIPYQFQELAKKNGFPMEKIIYLQCDIPEDDNLIIEHLDIVNTWYLLRDKTTQMSSQHARVRERMQRDYFLSIVDEFDDNTVFIASDCDEIIKPSVLNFITNFSRQHKDVILKIPLMHLQGRADLEMVDKSNDSPMSWDTAMFLAQLHHFRKNTPTQIRSQINIDFPIRYATQNNKIIRNLGWHFSWLGTSKHKKKKVNSFIHADEKMDHLEWGAVNNPQYRNFLETAHFRSGSIPPSGHKNAILRKIDLKELPDLLFSKREYIDFFFGLE